MTTAIPVPAIAALLQAISGRLTVPAMPLDSTGYTLAVRAANSDVRLAVAAILGTGCAPAAVAQFTRLLAAPPAFAEDAPLPEGHGPNHIDNAGHATLAACHDGRCVICGAAPEADGSHTTRSGARIAAVTA